MYCLRKLVRDSSLRFGMTIAFRFRRGYRKRLRRFLYPPLSIRFVIPIRSEGSIFVYCFEGLSFIDPFRSHAHNKEIIKRLKGSTNIQLNGSTLYGVVFLRVSSSPSFALLTGGYSHLTLLEFFSRP